MVDTAGEFPCPPGPLCGSIAEPPLSAPAAGQWEGYKPEHHSNVEFASSIKWFVRDFMEVLRMEAGLEGTNIRTSTIYPAAINTELLNAISDKAMAEQMQGLYNKYGISPDRIADIVAFAIDAPEDTTINEFTVGPTGQPW